MDVSSVGLDGTALLVVVGGGIAATLVPFPLREGTIAQKNPPKPLMDRVEQLDRALDFERLIELADETIKQ